MSELEIYYNKTNFFGIFVFIILSAKTLQYDQDKRFFIR